jgi:hypothetical protein
MDLLIEEYLLMKEINTAIEQGGKRKLAQLLPLLNAFPLEIASLVLYSRTQRAF